MTINCKGKLIDLSSPKVMGILNITPDSFYDGNKFSSEKKIIEQTKKMLDEGATFIDNNLTLFLTYLRKPFII